MKNIILLFVIILVGCKNNDETKPGSNDTVPPPGTIRVQDTIPIIAAPHDTLSTLVTAEKSFFYKAPDKTVYKVTVVPDEDPAANQPLNCNEVRFGGHDRKVAKISVATGATEQKTFENFLHSLKPDSFMKSLNISKDTNSNRVSFEKRNVKLKNVFLYAIKREPDNDYHLIIGSKTGTPFFTVEISGLPPTGSVAFTKLKQIRTLIETRFGVLCDPNFRKFSPGIPVDVSGSIFFDVDHSAGTVGPIGLRPQTAWEMHPATGILFH
ncbi:MAG: hypothetical protein M3Y85_05005 [Bacteroidota bacterium]|nr:hypothetical protein [Bacteroidota bacterium]